MKNVFYYMLHVAFVEIRAAESLNAAKKLADVFHNLPMRLNKDLTDEDCQSIYKDLLENAKRYGLESYVEELKKMAETALGDQ